MDITRFGLKERRPEPTARSVCVIDVFMGEAPLKGTLTADAIVVGAGVGGLSAAIALASRGYRVTLLERAQEVGGKMRRAVIDGASIDVGPTVLTMRWVFEDLFREAGARFDERVAVAPLEVLARHFWPDGVRFDLSADPAQTEADIARVFSARDVLGYQKFRAYAREIYDTIEEPFLRSQRPSVIDIVRRFGVGGLRELRRIDAYRSMWRSLGGFFESERLQQLFARYATYCGSSPFQAPATLNLIAHVEGSGVWRVEGGMFRLAEAMHELAASLGVEVRCGCEVEEVLAAQGRAQGVRLRGGETLRSRVVVVNADVQAIERGAFGEAAKKSVKVRGARSLSALTWAMTAEVEGVELAHHNVFFQDGAYEAEFQDIFTRDRLPEKPTAYLCAQDRRAGFTPGRAERIFCLVNAPPSGDARVFSADEIEACQTQMHALFKQSGLTLRPQTPPRVTTPSEFERRFPATGGGLYGLASHGWRSSFQRLGARTRLSGFYLAGGTIHPGAGVPMASLSGQLAAARILEDCPLSTSPRAAATRGGISTSSATIKNGG